MAHLSNIVARTARCPLAASVAGGTALLTLLSVGAVATLLPSVAQARDFKVGSIEIDNPWSPSAPDGAKVAGGYLTIVNHGAAPDRLLSATAAIAGKAELHRMTVKNGVMEMRPVKGGLEVPASGAVKLKPGAYHLMFMDLKHLPKKGETFAGTLTFEKAGKVDVTFDVTGMGGPVMDSGMKSMKMNSMKSMKAKGN